MDDLDDTDPSIDADIIDDIMFEPDDIDEPIDLLINPELSL